MKKLLILIGVVVLSACGGGGSSSSGSGASNGAPGATAYEGKYKGNMTMTFFFDGEAASQTVGLTVVIAQDGLVTMNTNQPDEGVVCPPAPPSYINGDFISMNGSATCYSPTLGTCNIDLEGGIRMSGNTGIGNADGTLKCSAVTAKFHYDIGITKT